MDAVAIFGMDPIQPAVPPGTNVRSPLRPPVLNVHDTTVRARKPCEPSSYLDQRRPAALFKLRVGKRFVAFGDIETGAENLFRLAGRSQDRLRSKCQPANAAARQNHPEFSIQRQAITDGIVQCTG